MDIEYNPETASVIDTNSWAILQLMEGEQAEAFQLLHKALNTSRVSLEGIAPQLRQALHHEQQQQPMEAVALDAHIHPISLQEVTVNRTNPVPDNYFRMYRSVYSIEGWDCESELLTPEVTVVLVYNLAVVYHEVGFCTADCTLIDKAMRLYELARMVLGRAREAKRQVLAMNLQELELAVLNNLGHTYAYFCRYEQMVTLRGSLQALVQQVDVTASPMEPDVYQFFVQNVLTALQQHPLPAAAA